MPEKRTALVTRYRSRPERFAKLMALNEEQAQKALANAPVTARQLPPQTPDGYRKAGPAERRIYYRALSRALGHRLEGLEKTQRALLLIRFRDGRSWKKACSMTGYSESGAMKVLRRTIHKPLS